MNAVAKEKKKTIELETFGGQHIRDVIAEAVAAAISKQSKVKFTFNETLFYVFPTDSLNSAKARWAAQTGRPILSADQEAAEARRNLDEVTNRHAKAIADAHVPTERELREAVVPWPKSADELASYIAALIHRPHDYGTCVYAMSMSAVAAFNYAAHVLGVTGFQASCADLDILRRTRHMEVFSIRDYHDMLYPQMEDKFARTISADSWKWLQEKAAALLAESNGHAADSVKQHWQSIVDGVVPFGFVIAS